MILLFEKENSNNINNYKKGILLLLLGVLALIFGHTVVKFFSNNIESIPTLLFISLSSSFIFSFLIGYKTIKQNLKFKNIVLINLIQTILYFFYFLILFYIYKLGNLGISYKIQSYSPFIPIILSAIIYKEKISFKKRIAIFLTLISLWFFI